MTNQFWSIVIICIIGLLIGRKYDKSLINPILIFNIIWLIVVILLKVGIALGYDEPSDEMMWIILVGCCAFDTISLLLTVFCRNGIHFFIGKQSYIEDYEPRINLITILLIGILLYSIINYRDILQQLIQGGLTLSDARDNYFHNIKGFFEGYIISPIRYAVIVNVILNVLYKKVNKIHLVLTLVVVLLSAFSSGGRLILINTVLMIIAALGLYAIRNIITKKQKSLIVLGVVFVLIAIIFITNYRTNTLLALGHTGLFDRVAQTFVSYFSGGPIYMSKMLEIHPIKMSTYGLSFIWGFLDVFLYFFAAIGVVPYPQHLSLGPYSTQVINIGNNTYFNAFFTTFGYYYADFGYIGVFFETAIFAFIIINVFSRAVKTKKTHMLNSAYYIMLFAILCNFSTRWLLYDSAFALSFIVIRLCYRKVKCYSANQNKELYAREGV